MNPDAKILRLPPPIREQINRRLQNGQAAKQIVQWLNTLSEVNGLMAAEFAGQPINKNDLASWQRGRYRLWEAQQEALATVVLFGDDATELSQAAGGQLADQLALCLTARLAVALRERGSRRKDAAGQWQRLRLLCALLVALRKGDHNAQWVRIEREKLDVKLKQFEKEEAARQREIDSLKNPKKGGPPKEFFEWFNKEFNIL